MSKQTYGSSTQVEPEMLTAVPVYLSKNRKSQSLFRFLFSKNKSTLKRYAQQEGCEFQPQLEPLHVDVAKLCLSTDPVMLLNKLRLSPVDSLHPPTLKHLIKKMNGRLYNWIQLSLLH